MEVGVGMDWGGGEGALNWVLVGMVNVLGVEAGGWKLEMEAQNRGWR